MNGRPYGALSDAVREVLRQATHLYRDRPRTAALLRDQLDRLDEPLRVAIAGKVKAGKSTLLNALVGEPVAPTDAGECTRVVTWYRDGHSPRVVMYPRSGAPVPLPVVRRDGALVIELKGAAAEDLDRLVVDWPSQGLRGTTLIDTPGIASMSTQTARRTLTFIDPEEADTPTEADAVVYLMRHLHTADIDLLEAFRDQGVASAGAVNAIAVISRADEIGAGRVDAMISARAIAHRYRAEPTVRGLCQDVVAVAGLLAETGRTLRHAEFVTMARLAGVPRTELEAALLSVDRFRRAEGAVADAVEIGEDRDALLRRFGLFGIRLATTLIRQGTTDSPTLAAELVARSGLPDLQRVLHTQFTQRRDLLKARSALLALERVLRADGRTDGPLAAQVERILANAHEFTELRLLSALRSGAVTLPREMAGEAERLLGAAGPAPRQRLGLPAGCGALEVRNAALATLHRWQNHAVNPMFGRAATEACRVVIRSCEGMLAALTPR
ncbi:dynamin family protein [Pseudonocardia hispaniensis]|uniref:Dynamin family protein n=1 Tax=Pseudonocardia hispaniensis TaxID=904933 RepID=A0ABW1J8I1_9PSEU